MEKFFNEQTGGQNLPKEKQADIIMSFLINRAAGFESCKYKNVLIEELDNSAKSFLLFKIVEIMNMLPSLNQVHFFVPNKISNFGWKSDNGLNYITDKEKSALLDEKEILIFSTKESKAIAKSVAEPLRGVDEATCHEIANVLYDFDKLQEVKGNGEQEE